jgi:hypothetical protein
MSPPNKGVAKTALGQLRAEGGTNILAGMQHGWAVMASRQSRNPASCVFLLTDGQDRNNLNEKLSLAREMKYQGTSVFVFGFGADHDSEHMEGIANAAEGNFTYIEGDDMVADAFGGTIGIQQGASLSNICVSMCAVEREVSIVQVAAGKYTTMTEKRQATVSFVNMYMGESRDVLLKLSIPASDVVVDYELIVASATFQVQGADTSGQSGQTSGTSGTSGQHQTHQTDAATCLVQRLHADSLGLNPLTRDTEVDVQLSRHDCNSSVAEALSKADQGDLESAQTILGACKGRLQVSNAYMAGHSVVVGMMQELDDALVRVQSRRQYDYGGRAMMQEALSSNTYQRSTYTKAGRCGKYQTAGSSGTQERFGAYKGSK